MRCSARPSSGCRQDIDVAGRRLVILRTHVQVIVVVTAQWDVLCYDHNLRLMWTHRVKVLRTCLSFPAFCTPKHHSLPWETC